MVNNKQIYFYIPSKFNVKYQLTKFRPKPSPKPQQLRLKPRPPTPSPKMGKHPPQKKGSVDGNVKLRSRAVPPKTPIQTKNQNRYKKS